MKQPNQHDGAGTGGERPPILDNGVVDSLVPAVSKLLEVQSTGGISNRPCTKMVDARRTPALRRRNLIFLNRILSACFLFAATVTLIILTLFTSYAPDTYVFVKYAYDHTTDRAVQFQSLLDNNVIFDVLSVAGARLGFSTGTEYLLMLTGLNALVLLVKYGYLLRKGRLVDVVTVFAASFYALDLNLFRLNLALIILFIGLSCKSRISRIAAQVTSGVTHFIPICATLLKRCYYIPLFLLAVVPLSVFDQKTRLYIYLLNKDLTPYKSLMFVLPFLVCYLDRRFKQRVHDPMMQVAEAFAVTGAVAIFFNTLIVARFFELAFIVTAVANVFRRFSYLPRVFLMLFALVAFAQRTSGGINAGDNNFVNEFVLDPSIIRWFLN